MNYNDVVGFDPNYLSTKEKYTTGGEIIQLINSINKMKTNDVKRGISYINTKIEKEERAKRIRISKLHKTIKGIKTLTRLTYGSQKEYEIE